MSYGYIYVMVNRALPDVVKVGYTMTSPQQRARELSTTGIPQPFEVYAYGTFYGNDSEVNCIENLCHAALAEHRVNANREFFAVSPEAALKVIRQFESDNNAQAQSELAQARAQAQRIVEEKRSIVSQAQRIVDQTESEIAQARAQAQREISQAQAQAERIVEQARAQAQKIAALDTSVNQFKAFLNWQSRQAEASSVRRYDQAYGKKSFFATLLGKTTR